MAKPKILIVDDEKEARESLNNFLARNIDCDICEAPDGRKALELLQKDSFDLILLDIKMPGISGIDVLKKATASHPDTDIIIISAWDSQPIAGEALQGGAVDYITKPSTINVIYSKVCEILKKRNKYTPKIKS